MTKKEHPYPEAFRAPQGKFRVVQIDIGAATGLSGEPENCSRVVGDEPTLKAAIRSARQHIGDGFEAQIHDANGACVWPKL